MSKNIPYQPEFSRQAEKLCKLGATDKDLAVFFGVSERTVNKWKRTYPTFMEAVRAGKQIADMNVAESLYRRATGYAHEATKLFQHNGKVIMQEYTEHYPPDVTAILFWLKNRRPDLWREKPEPQLSEDEPVKVTLKLK